MGLIQWNKWYRFAYSLIYPLSHVSLHEPMLTKNDRHISFWIHNNLCYVNNVQKQGVQNRNKNQNSSLYEYRMSDTLDKNKESIPIQMYKFLQSQYYVNPCFTTERNRWSRSTQLPSHFFAIHKYIYLIQISRCSIKSYTSMKLR